MTAAAPGYTLSATAWVSVAAGWLAGMAWRGSAGPLGAITKMERSVAPKVRPSQNYLEKIGIPTLSPPKVRLCSNPGLTNSDL